MFDLLLYIPVGILFLNCYMYSGMDFSACRSIDVPVVAAVQVGVPVHGCWSCGSAEIPYQREDECRNLGLQILCASLAYSDGNLSMAILYYFGYLVSW